MQSRVAVVVMGVQGVGKSTIGRMLSERLDVPFIEGDDLHPARNVELMAAGTPLTDADREPWLHSIGGSLADRPAGGAVVTCSALRRRYRDLLREYAPDAYFVEPWGTVELVSRRVGARTHDYMPPQLLTSQFATLEPLQADEAGIRISVENTPEQIVDAVLADLRRAAEQAP